MLCDNVDTVDDIELIEDSRVLKLLDRLFIELFITLFCIGFSELLDRVVSTYTPPQTLLVACGKV